VDRLIDERVLVRGADGGRRARRVRDLVAALDIGVKVVLTFFLALVAVDPTWGNLEGKAPVARAVTYPLVAFVAPLVLRLCRPASPFPWGVDLLISLGCFSDILGNRLDLYDTIQWFDDWMHFMNTALLSGAVVAITTTAANAGAADVVQRAVGLGMTMALGWEIVEYVSFVTRSSELPTAYADTVVDLSLGWAGSVVAGATVATIWWRRLQHDGGPGAKAAPRVPPARDLRP
jgi:hypothetical protein